LLNFLNIWEPFFHDRINVIASKLWNARPDSGSHNSATSSLIQQEPIAADQPAYVRALSGQDMVHRAIYNWSRDQSLTLTQQAYLYLLFNSKT
jgi:hypothetical protein